MTIKLLDTVTIAAAWLPVIVNDDWSGLSDFDCDQLEHYLKGMPAGMIFDCKEWNLWARDCVTGLWADCCEVDIYG